MAKLAAWMKAKAQMEASDLASSLVPLMMPKEPKVKTNYDLPQGEDKKTNARGKASC